MMYGGLRIFEDIYMTDRHEDWSSVRSPSRAKRRRKMGHPQKIKIVYLPRKDVVRVGDKLVMHPEVATALRARIDAENALVRP